MLRCLLTLATVAVASAATELWSFDANSSMGAPAAGPDGAVYVIAGEGVHAFNSDGTTRWTFKLSAGDAFNRRQPIIIGKDGSVYLHGSGPDGLDAFLCAIKPDGNLGWIFKTDIYMTAAASIGKDGTVYQPGDNGTFYAVHSDGSSSWNFTFPWWTRSPPLVGNDGTIYVSVGNGQLTALRPDGTQKWNFNAPGNMFSASPTIGEGGVLYVGSEYGDFGIFAVNPDGSRRWKFNGTDDSGESNDCLVRHSPTLGQDGTVYFNCGSALYAVHKNGTEAWKLQNQAELTGSPSVGPDGTVYTKIAGNGWLIAMASDGTKRGTWPPTSTPSAQSIQKANAAWLHSTATVGTPWASGDAVVFGRHGEIYASHDYGAGAHRVVALDSDIGSTIWDFNTLRHIDSDMGSIAVGLNGTVFVVSYLPWNPPQRNTTYSVLSAVRGDAPAASFANAVQQGFLV